MNNVLVNSLLLFLATIYLSSCVSINDDKYPETFEPICKEINCCKNIEGIYEIDHVESGALYSSEELRLSTSVRDSSVIEDLVKLTDDWSAFPTRQHVLDIRRLDVRLNDSGNMDLTCYSVDGNVIELKTLFAGKDFTCKNGVVKFREIVEGWRAECTWTTKSKVNVFCSEKDNLIVQTNRNSHGIVMWLPFIQSSKDWAHLKKISN